jgi:hypothetical protein
MYPSPEASHLALIQKLVLHLDNSWDTHHQKQVTLHWHKEISSVQTAASGQQLRYPSPEAWYLVLTQEISSVQTGAPGQQLRHPPPEATCHLALTQRNYFSTDCSIWTTADAPITRSKSPCTDTEISSAPGQQLRHPPPEASHLALTQRN